MTSATTFFSSSSSSLAGCCKPSSSLVHGTLITNTTIGLRAGGMEEETTKAKPKTANKKPKTKSKPKNKKNIAFQKRQKTAAVSSSFNNNNKKSDTLRRIQREWKDMIDSGMAYNWRTNQPVKNKQQQQHIWIGPIHSSLLIWHFTLSGMPGSSFQNGLYHGRMILPDNYPLAPPRIQVWTPSGRFATRVDICISASNYHPELWTTNWTIRTIVEALRLHFITHTLEVGGINESHEQRLEHAKASRTFQCHIPINSRNIITVDHAEMVRQGLFIEDVVEAEEEEYDDTVDSMEEQLSEAQAIIVPDHDDTAAASVAGEAQESQAADGISNTMANATCLSIKQQSARKTKTPRVKPPAKQGRSHSSSMSTKHTTTTTTTTTTVRPAATATTASIQILHRPSSSSESSILISAIQKMFKHPLLWSLLVLFCWLNRTRA